MAGIDVNFAVFESSNRGFLVARSPDVVGAGLALALTIFPGSYRGNIVIEDGGC
jgi:hypothetical protein